MIVTIFTILQVVSALALVGLIMSQATKSEGLTGSIGGKAESAFQGKPGFEQRISKYTEYAAIAFMALSILHMIVRR